MTDGPFLPRPSQPLPGPAVTVCGNPDCSLPFGCDRVRPGVPLGLAWLFDRELQPPPDDVLAAVFRRQLALGFASDSSGTRRVIPDGCEFTVHRSSIPGEHGERQYMAVYSGPARDVDEALAGAAEYDQAEAEARVARMWEAGLLSAMLAWQPAA
jgi:hypothetical protein